jgi:hypothetical protein
MKMHSPKLLALSLALFSFDAAASIITFDFSNKGTNATSLSFASGGVTITLTNPAGNGSYTGFQTDSDGLFISNAGAAFNLGALTSMNLKFSTAAKITAYAVGYSQTISSGSFNLTGGRADGASSLNNTMTSAGSYTLSSPFILDANQIGTFTATINGGSTRLSELKTLTIDTNVPSGIPEPGSLALLTIGMAGFAARRKNSLV